MTMVPQFVMGKRNMITGTLSHSNQLIGSEWPGFLVHSEEVASDSGCFCHLSHQEATRLLLSSCRPIVSGQLRCYIGGIIFRSTSFLLFAIVKNIFNKLRMSTGVEMTQVAPFWRQECFLDLLELLVEPPLSLPQQRDLLFQPYFCRFHCSLPKHQGFSRVAAHQLSL